MHTGLKTTSNTTDTKNINTPTRMHPVSGVLQGN